LIRAAGRGERLRPLTDSVPKPLVEVAGQALLARHLERLAAAGFHEAVINVSHLAGQILERFGDGARYGIAIEWSREETPLETAGGVAKALPLIGDRPFLLVNSDVWSDFDFARWKNYDLGGRLAHLLLVRNPRHHPAGDFTLDDGTVGNAASPRYTYAGMAVIAPRLVAGVRPGEKAQLAPLWRAAAERGEVSGELHEGHWSDVGTPERLAELEGLLKKR
jgi:MurNAc alpha-1-phosphate uridylyltransferase